MKGRPAALLLDFGGVIVQTRRRPEWAAELAAVVHEQLAAAGAASLTVDEIRTDIEAGAAADRYWKHAMSRPRNPREMTHRRFWADFVAADWPDPARALVTAHATALCARLGELRQERCTREGIEKLLHVAAGDGIRVAIVSNAMSGAVHRDHLTRAGLDRRVAAQVYSDEVGVRKPNPEIIWLAADALGVLVAGCWYVGDKFDRDVVCGRRAGVGATILMEARGTYTKPYDVRHRPDAVVADPRELSALLRESR